MQNMLNIIKKNTKLQIWGTTLISIALFFSKSVATTPFFYHLYVQSYASSYRMEHLCIVGVKQLRAVMGYGTSVILDQSRTNKLQYIANIFNPILQGVP